MTKDQALTEMTRQLRQGKRKHGLILANGGVATYQHVVCLSTQPRKDGSAYPAKNPLPEVITNIPVPKIEENPEGESVIEVSCCRSGRGFVLIQTQTYTVEFNRDGTPSKGHVVGRLKSNGRRFLANEGDASTLTQLCSTTEEPIGRSGYVVPDSETPGRNLFSFSRPAKL